MSHRKRGKGKTRGKRAAKAVSRPRPSLAACHPDAAALLAGVAAALNACERAGVEVKLAHGAVIAEAGYVFSVGPHEAPWAVRTRMLEPFSPPEGDDLDS